MDNYINKYKQLNIAGKIIAIEIAVWLLTQLTRLTPFSWPDWLALHADLDYFLFTPWTLFTYMWVHADIGQDMFHIIFNMFWLWWFGQIFLQTHNNKQFLQLFIFGGLFAGACFLLSGNGLVVGASGAIFALVAAVAVSRPDDPIYLNLVVKMVMVRLKWFALIALAINLLDLSSGENTGGIICHLGGMLFGVIFALNERYGWTRKWFSPRPKMTATRGGARTVRTTDRQKDMDYNQQKRERQEKVDAILDKISRTGYDGLTAEEKAMLFDASQRKKS